MSNSNNSIFNNIIDQYLSEQSSEQSESSNASDMEGSSSSSTITRKRLSEEEKVAIFNVFSKISGQTAREVALNMLGVNRNYKSMANFYSRHCKKNGIAMSSPRVRYTAEQKAAIKRIFTELTNHKERKAVIGMMPCFEGRSYNSLYQQYAIMTREERSPTSPTGSTVAVGTKRQRDDESDVSSNSDSSSDSEVEGPSFTSASAKRQRVAGYDSDGNDPLVIPPVEEAHTPMFNNYEGEPLEPLPILPPSYMVNGDEDLISNFDGDEIFAY